MNQIREALRRLSTRRVGTHRNSDICIVGLNYPPEPTGIAPYTGSLATGLQRLGMSVTAHVGHPHYPEWSIHDGYGQWTRSERLDDVEVLRRLHYVPRAPRGIRRLLSELSFGVRLAFATLDRPRVIIAVSPSLFSTALAALRVRLTPNRPALVIWVQDLYTLGIAETGEGGGLVQKVTRYVEARTLQAADRVVVIHQRFADYVTQELEVDRSRVDVIRNWTHLAPSMPVEAAAARTKLGWSSDVVLAVHAGNMGAKQGLENIVDAARIADERGDAVQFILVGDGGERRALELRADGTERLTFVDPLGDKDFRLALGAAHVLIVNEKPGISAMAVPSKLTSYFDAARPVVAATDPDGITASEIAAAGAGVIVRAGDPVALLDAVVAVGTDSRASAQFGIKGRRYREEVLDQDAAIEHWAKVLDSVAAIGRAGTAL